MSKMKPGEIDPIDGIRNHPDADENCPKCNGGGWLDDSSMLMMCLEPCPCTKKAIERLYNTGSVD